jgi:hypothetical protein
MVRPLTRIDRNGTLYVRPPAVETQIAGALALDIPTLGPRLSIRDSHSPDYLKSECLVHLVREAMRAGDHAKANALLPILLLRCEATLLAKVPDGRLPDAIGIRDEILGQFSEMFVTDGAEPALNELDYFECQFNSAFRTLRIDIIRSQTAHLKYITPLPESDIDEEPESDDEVLARLSKAAQIAATQEGDLLLASLIDAVESLPPDERQAVALCHILGYKEESDNPDVVTAATLCKCTGRTIRNRLTRAAAKLSRFKEDI